MGTRRPTIKTEHAGAKNGGGYWGPRSEAKAVSKYKRRQMDKAAVNSEADAPRREVSKTNLH